MSRDFNNYRLHLIGHRPLVRGNSKKIFKEFPDSLKIDVEITTGFWVRETGLISGEVITGFGVDTNGNINFTGYSGYSYSYDYEIKNLNSFSGFNFYGDISVGKTIRQAQVNLGESNRNLYGSRAGVVGNSNTASASTSGSSITNNFSYIFGTANTLNKSDDAVILGSKSQIDSANLSISIGDNNKIINGRWNTLNIGFNNLITGYTGIKSADSYNIGWNNKSINVSGAKVFGESNSIVSGKDNLVLGENIFLQNSDQVNAIGKNLSIQKGFYDTVIGYGNTLDYTYENALLGVESEIFDSSKSYLIGRNNLSTGDDNNYILGVDNESTLNKDSHIIGDDNLISNSANVTFLGNSSEINKLIDSVSIGETNKLNDSYGLTVLGKGNEISGVFDGLIIGQYNRQDYNALEDLHRSELTGVTGQVTGYHYSNSYYAGAQTPKTAGDNLYIFGKSNNGTENYNSFVFGEENISIENYKSYVVGNNNTTEKTVNSFIFGENNSVSGSRNYVFGNNNVIRSGDYNSILIGISHEFTGDYKVASVNIASVNSNIEVSPTEVKINSPSRMKFNNDNVTVASDLNNLLNRSNGLSNSGAFESYIINDRNYTTLADQIELQSFAYSGKENRYYGGFSGFNASSANAYYFTGFFRQQEVFSYTGIHTIYGKYYYQSSNENFEILFSREIEPITGNWIISPKNNMGFLFYNESTNTGVLPLSGWITTGSSDTEVSGLSPAPSFKYSPDFTGFFPKQKINSSEFYASNYFNIFGSVSYPSNDDIAVIYGNHLTPKFSPTWLIVDKYSSGVYYINNSTPITTTPQFGWIATGYMGYTGRNPEDLTNALPDTGIKISLGTRSGIISSYDPTYGNIYIPFLY